MALASFGKVHVFKAEGQGCDSFRSLSQRVHRYYHYELGPKRPSPLWVLGPNSIIVVYMDPLGFALNPTTPHARACRVPSKNSRCSDSRVGFPAQDVTAFINSQGL